MKSLQVLLNKTARILTRLSWFTPTRILMKNSNWMSVHQLAQYYTLVSMFSIVNTGSPKYLFDKINSEHQYDTRAAVKYGENFTGKSALASNSFCYRGALLFNKLPLEIRELRNKATFKRKAKKWILPIPRFISRDA